MNRPSGASWTPGVPQGHHGGPVEARGGAVPDPHPIDRPSRRGAGDDRPARTWHGGTPRLPAAAQADGRRPRPTASCDALGGRREVPAVRGERQPLDRGGSSVHRPGREDRPDEPAGRRVPDPDLAVGAPGGGEPAVGRERVAGHAEAGWSRGGPERPARSRLPEPGRMVRAGGQDDPAVGAEAGGPDRVPMLKDGQDAGHLLLPAGRVGPHHPRKSAASAGVSRGPRPSRAGPGRHRPFGRAPGRREFAFGHQPWIRGTDSASRALASAFARLPARVASPSARSLEGHAGETPRNPTIRAASIAAIALLRRHTRASRNRPDRPHSSGLPLAEAHQVFGHRHGAGIATAGLLLQAVQRDRLQVSRHAGAGRCRGRVGSSDVTARSSSRVLSRLEWQSPRRS